MYFILYKNDFAGNWKTWMKPDRQGIAIFDTLDTAEKQANRLSEARVFCLSHTVKEQMQVASKVAELTNMVDEAITKAQKLNVL